MAYSGNQRSGMVDTGGAGRGETRATSSTALFKDKREPLNWRITWPGLCVRKRPLAVAHARGHTHAMRTSSVERGN